jgi:hypothetical protein
MSSMADPINALNSLQQALNDGTPLGLSELDSNYQTRYDEYPVGHRYLFARLLGHRTRHTFNMRHLRRFTICGSYTATTALPAV